MTTPNDAPPDLARRSATWLGRLACRILGHDRNNYYRVTEHAFFREWCLRCGKLSRWSIDP